MQVHLKNGEEKWILVHIEVQGYREIEFAERMFKYFYRAYDKYQKQIFTIAIFSDEHKSYQPNEYQYKFLDTELTYRYRTYKILEQKETELKKSRNIFAMAVLAGLYAIKSKKDMDIRYKFKVSLSRLLLEQKQSRKKIEDMFIFIDGILSLPKEQGLKFAAELNTILERGDEDMGLTWSKSNLAAVYREEGREEGATEKQREIVLNMLKTDLNESLIQQVTGLSETEIKRLAKEL